MYFSGVHLQHQKDTFMLNAVILRRSSHDEARPVTDLSAQQGGLCSSANNLNNLNNLNLPSFLPKKYIYNNSDFKLGSFAILAMLFN